MSPALSNFYQTLSTLRFASRAKAVRNQPQINEIHDSPLHQEIAHLQAQLSLRDQQILELRSSQQHSTVSLQEDLDRERKE